MGNKSFKEKVVEEVGHLVACEDIKGFFAFSVAKSENGKLVSTVINMSADELHVNAPAWGGAVADALHDMAAALVSVCKLDKYSWPDCNLEDEVCCGPVPCTAQCPKLQDGNCKHLSFEEIKVLLDQTDWDDEYKGEVTGEYVLKGMK